MSSGRSFKAAIAAGVIGMAAAEAPAGGGAALAVPAPVEIAGTTMCTIPGWEYAPRWEYNKGVMTPGLEACAQVCEADPVCTGATFIEWVNPEGKTNCYLKSWAQPDGPAATPCYPGPSDANKMFHALMQLNAGSCAVMKFADPPLECGAENELYPEAGMSSAPFIAGAVTTTTPAVAPEMAMPPAVAAVVPAVAPMADMPAAPVTVAGDMYTVGSTTFQALPDMDYFGPDRLILNVDIGKGIVAADDMECLQACVALAAEGCNAVSYYGMLPEGEWPGGKNCYPKTIDSTCAPTDILMAPNTVLMMVTSEYQRYIFALNRSVGADAMGPGMAAAGPVVAPSVVPTAVLAPTVAPAMAPVPTVDDVTGVVPPVAVEEPVEQSFDTAPSPVESETATREADFGGVSEVTSGAKIVGATAAAAIFGAAALFL